MSLLSGSLGLCWDVTSRGVYVVRQYNRSRLQRQMAPPNRNLIWVNYTGRQLTLRSLHILPRYQLLLVAIQPLQIVINRRVRTTHLYRVFSLPSLAFFNPHPHSPHTQIQTSYTSDAIERYCSACKSVTDGLNGLLDR